MKNGKGMEKMDVESRIERSLPNWPRTVVRDIFGKTSRIRIHTKCWGSVVMQRLTEARSHDHA